MGKGEQKWGREEENSRQFENFLRGMRERERDILKPIEIFGEEIGARGMGV
ncbi:MAG: hypothetical protein NT157_06340 [Candidatus Micrarchaeota archaeon]|nr:hypothetical protein [Candidatus Micrarchaeota archaeon]